MALITIRLVETIVIDTETNEIISSVRTTENSEGVAAPVTKPKKATTKKEKVVDDSPACVTLQEGKLVLNPKAIEVLGAVAGDRICVGYEQLENGAFVPVIGTQANMGDSVEGNKLTKTATVSYKGKQHASLAQFGDVFPLTVKEDKTAYMMDPNHVGLLDIVETDLAPMPEVKESEIPAENTEQGLDNPDLSGTFDFDF